MGTIIPFPTRPCAPVSAPPSAIRPGSIPLAPAGWQGAWVLIKPRGIYGRVMGFDGGRFAVTWTVYSDGQPVERLEWFRMCDLGRQS